MSGPTCSGVQGPPGNAKDRVGADAPKEPPEYVVLLYDLFGQLPLGDARHDVRARYHHSSPGDPSATFARTPQRRTIRP